MIIVIVIAHFKVDLAGSESLEGMNADHSSLQDHFVCPVVYHVFIASVVSRSDRTVFLLASGRLLNLGCANGHHSFLMLRGRVSYSRNFSWIDFYRMKSMVDFPVRASPTVIMFHG